MEIERSRLQEEWLHIGKRLQSKENGERKRKSESVIKIENLRANKVFFF